MNQIFAFAATGFWMFMIFDCVRNEPDRSTWIWLLILLNLPGSVIYGIVRFLPRQNVPMPSLFNRWTLRQKRWNAEAAVRNIGKAHQYITLANLLVDLREWEQASQHYQQALDKEPHNTDALWGLSVIEVRQKAFAAARDHLKTLLKQDPQHKYGDASLQYGKVLFELQDWDNAEIHLKADLQEWRHPEAAWLLAQIQIQKGDRQAAKEVLDQMLFNVKASPNFHYKRHRALIGKAERLLRTL